MSYLNLQILDGYSLDTSDGYSFTTPWIDIKQFFAYSISTTFSDTPSGTLILTLTQ